MSLLPEPREGWQVNLMHPYRAVKDYVCPACFNRIPSGEGHVVAWRDDELDERRHWHKHCWRLEARRDRG